MCKMDSHDAKLYKVGKNPIMYSTLYPVSRIYIQTVTGIVSRLSTAGEREREIDKLTERASIRSTMGCQVARGEGREEAGEGQCGWLAMGWIPRWMCLLPSYGATGVSYGWGRSVHKKWRGARELKVCT